MGGASTDDKPMRRTPKTGIMRQWILMGEKRRILLVLGVALVALFSFRSFMMGTAPPSEYHISHTLTADEKAQLEAQIREEVASQHRDKLKALTDSTSSERDRIESQIRDEEDKEEGADPSKLTSLRDELKTLEAKHKKEIAELQKQYEAEVEGIVSAEFAKRQNAIIAERADKLLVWFCDNEDDGSAWPVEEHVVELGTHPCIGVASEGDPGSGVHRYVLSNGDVARTIASQALLSIQNGTHEVEMDAVFRSSKLAKAQYHPSKPSRCCDDVQFGVHPVFGVFYKILLPLIDRSADDFESETFTTKSVCFRRKFHPRPVVKPFSAVSRVNHLVHPSELLDPAPAPAQSQAADTPSSGRRVLKQTDAAAAGDVPSFPVGTVNLILPFRGTHLDLLPSLIKGLGRLKRNGDLRNALPFRLIIAPISWETGTEVTDAKERVNKIAAAASEALEFSITVVDALPDTELTKDGIVSLVRPWLDTSGEVKPIRENSDPAAAGILPNPWVAAVLGAMKVVDRTRAPVLVLDSATYALSPDFVSKTRWRIVNGHMVYAPILSSVASPREVGFQLQDGGASFTAEEMEDLQMTVQYEDKSWWQDVDEMNDWMDDDAWQRRRLRGEEPAAMVAPAKATKATKAATKATKAGAGRRRLLSEDETEVTTPELGPDTEPGEEEELESMMDDDYDLFVDDAWWDTNQFGDNPDELLWDVDDDEILGTDDDLWEGDEFDPILEDGYDGGFGDGDGWADIDDPHSFGQEDEFEYYGSEFEYGSAGSEVKIQTERVTTLGATRADLAGMFMRMLEAKGPTTARENRVEGDNCIALRLLSVARGNGYRVVRNVLPGAYVATDMFDLYSDIPDAEIGTCDCDTTSAPKHCRLVLDQVEVDDPWDSTRVNCVITSMMASQHVDSKVQKEQQGASGDVKVADLVRVTHAARFFKPSAGIDIVAKVLKRKQSEARLLKKKKTTTTTSPAPTYGPEVFLFQFRLSHVIRLRQEVPSTVTA